MPRTSNVSSRTQSRLKSRSSRRVSEFCFVHRFTQISQIFGHKISVSICEICGHSFPSIMMQTPDSQRMEKIVSLCKRRGFIFQSSEIYGGLNGLWDYGPRGVELKRNLK